MVLINKFIFYYNFFSFHQGKDEDVEVMNTDMPLELRDYTIDVISRNTNTVRIYKVEEFLIISKFQRVIKINKIYVARVSRFEFEA